MLTEATGGRTAWSSTVTAFGKVHSARFWYDGKYVDNAREDAAEVALNWLASEAGGYAPGATMGAAVPINALPITPGMGVTAAGGSLGGSPVWGAATAAAGQYGAPSPRPIAPPMHRYNQSGTYSPTPSAAGSPPASMSPASMSPTTPSSTGRGSYFY